jgi:fucose 4-O-acetylase-like acetyltransferase
MDDKNQQLNTLRGLACIFLVAFHVVGGNSGSGMRLSEGFLREFNDALIYIRMPLFTFLSGFVYAYRPFTENAPLFVLKKSRRLILPMLTVGTIFAVLQSLTPGTNYSVSNWFLLHIIPVGHFWFVESLFFIFLIVVALERLSLFSSSLKFWFVFFVASLFFISPISISYFSISGVIYLFPFFIFGMGVHRYGMLKNTQSFFLFFLVLFIILVFMFVYFNIIPFQDRRSLFSLFVGCLSCLLLYKLRFSNAFIAFVGVFSYSIYLFHVFFTASSRILLNKINVDNIYLVFIFSIFAGLLGPIITEVIFSKNRYSSLWLLGQKVKNRKSIS